MGDMTLDLTPRGAASIEALVNGPIQTNSYVVISNDECLIVDPAWEGERLVEHIRTAHPRFAYSALSARTVMPTMLAGRRGSSCRWRQRTI
ncbi:MAG: MBL fold metallo-hydrolase [Collinsella sp.]